MLADLQRVLLDEATIADRVRSLGEQISADLADSEADGGITIVPILTGSLIFVADLVRHLQQRLRLDLVTVSSYPGRSVASRGAQIDGAIPEDLAGKHVLVVDDILDSGGTLSLVQRVIGARRPKSLRTCVLLRKPKPSAVDVHCDYVGFDIPDVFVVGYGLDYDGYYRNLPCVGVLREDLV
ncbi:MAG: hypoxanthine phosphoribosyltransferase [Planctomycetota bacterium]|jgi:hypoxanthine phosphoribosyltransferase